MSLKFGIYLVEQRIISPEQFCGLVKIQQESSMSAATIALRKNIMTIKQVAEVLDLAEFQPEKSFVTVALESDMIDRADADLILHTQQISTPSIRKLVVECGLLTQRQTSVLFSHFDKSGYVSEPAAVPAAGEPSGQTTGPRAPKFHQHPIIVRQPTL